MQDWIVLKTYSSRPEAELARSRLSAEGIASVIQADDAGGMQPALLMLGGVKLLVTTTDRYRAEQILADCDGTLESPESSE